MTLSMLILAGGYATRIKPLTENIPKSLVQINGKPFVDWQLNLLARKGISEVVLSVSYRADLIKNYVGDGSKYNICVKYSEDGNRQLGTGGAIKKALPLLTDKFMVLYGDSYLDLDYKKAEKAFNLISMPAMMTVYKNSGKYDKSNVKLESSGLAYYDKSTVDTDFNHIDYGLNFLSKSIFKSKKWTGSFDLADVFREISSKGELGGLEVSDRFYEIGSFEGIEDFANFLKKEKHVIY
jgi:MurNAc alpha-1-phosphate uridylyltransferase